LSRIDTRMTPAEAAAWWRRQTEEERHAHVSTAESLYVCGGHPCAVDHGRGNVGERKVDRVDKGRDRAAGEWYCQSTVRI
jgi:hypothetical protein